MEQDDELAANIMGNTRRYCSIFSDVIFELLPTYKEREVVAKDSLDVYIEHRMLMESRNRRVNEDRDIRNQFPQELMKRL